MSELHFQPIKGKAREILKAILQTPEVSSCSLKDGFVLRLACEEIVMNVTSYAYPDDVEGFIDIEIEKTDHRIMIRFKDGGAPFNPLERPRPDTKLHWKKRRMIQSTSIQPRSHLGSVSTLTKPNLAPIHLP